MLRLHPKRENAAFSLGFLDQNISFCTGNLMHCSDTIFLLSLRSRILSSQLSLSSSLTYFLAELRLLVCARRRNERPSISSLSLSLSLPLSAYIDKSRCLSVGSLSWSTRVGQKMVKSKSLFLRLTSCSASDTAKGQEIIPGILVFIPIY